MNNKKLILAVIALVAVVAVFAGVYIATRPDAAEGQKSFTLTVVHADGTEKVLELTTTERYLAPALKKEGILLAEEGSDGMYNTVDGETTSWDENQSYWGFYIDGEYAITGLNDTSVTDGSAYKLVYTVYDAEE